MSDFTEHEISKTDWTDPSSAHSALGASKSLPIPKKITPKEVGEQARGHATRIFLLWERLRDILSHHEITIHKRWLKKTKKQRHEILRKAWPNIADIHRPDFRAFRHESESQRDAGTRFREPYIWPYINLEDLSKPRTLLLFLQSRSDASPDAFAHADLEAIHLGLVTKAVVPAFLNEHTMMLNSSTPERYGELLSWDDNENAFEWLMSQKGMRPGEGLLVLEAQQRVLQFLVDCCQEIMHDISAEDLVSDTYPVQPRETMAKETVSGFSSLAILAAEAPYRKPADMDLKRLVSLIEAKKSGAEDHLWSLREDPSYFAETLLEFRANRQEMLNDTNGNAHHLLKSPHSRIFWERIIGNVLGNAYLQLEMWSELYEQAKNLAKLQSNFQDVISAENDLPEEYLNALLVFRHFLNQAAKGPKELLKHHVVSSPPFRHLFVRTPPRDLTSTTISITSKPGAKATDAEGDLFWLLRILWEDDQELFLIGFTNLMDELERLLQSDLKIRELVSNLVEDQIADLAVMSEALRQINHYHPWSDGFDHRSAQREELIKERFSRRTEHWGLLLNPIVGPGQKLIVQLGTVEGQKFLYPIEKRHTKDNIDALRQAEQNLDKFWFEVDQNVQKRMGENIKTTALWRLLSQSKILQRTAEWVAPELSRISDDNMYETLQPLSALYFDLEYNTERTLEQKQAAKPPKTKKKTKGVAIPRGATGLDIPAVEEGKSLPVFKLDARGQKVFRTLFFTATVDGTPGEVPWTDFLHAMTVLGFEAARLYGSVWQFQPSNLDVKRSIQIHEPHPSNKLPYRTARRIGRRLHRAYGFQRGMFVLK